jgi:hypothetical protein
MRRGVCTFVFTLVAYWPKNEGGPPAWTKEMWTFFRGFFALVR